VPVLNVGNDFQDNEKFEGTENPLLYARSYDLEFNCEFELLHYPFDRQTCYITV
jgi:hypothetical protein